MKAKKQARLEKEPKKRDLSDKKIVKARERKKMRAKHEQSLLKIEIEKINSIKNTILDLGTKFGKMQIMEIVEVCPIKDKQLIIKTVKTMIENKEIYAQYFESSKSVAFDQQSNIVEIDKLMESYKEWEDDKVGKK